MVDDEVASNGYPLVKIGTIRFSMVPTGKLTVRP